MAVESNYAITIATLTDWMKNLRQVFLANEKQNPSHLVRAISRALKKLYVISRNSDRFIATLTPVVIGWTNYFGIAF